MKPGKGVVDALNECLRWERTLAGCFQGYHEYFERWHFTRLKRWFKRHACAARGRVDDLEDRINDLDTVPGQAAFAYEVIPVNKADDISKVWAYFNESLEDARDAYERTRKACKDAGDSVSAGLCKRGKAGVEDSLIQVEEKVNKVKLIGAVAYLAHHMHPEG